MSLGVAIDHLCLTGDGQYIDTNRTHLGYVCKGGDFTLNLKLEITDQVTGPDVRLSIRL